MEKFIKLKGIAAPLPMMNVDTDMIIPKQFLKTIKKSGLGKNLFHELRYDLQGNIKNDFVLNWDPYKSARILITGENFGCGSSREHAPWALADFGFKTIIAESFADIFYNNCFKNGILPITLNKKDIQALFENSGSKPGFSLNVKLDKQSLTDPSGNTFNFELEGFRKDALLKGLDEIELTLSFEKDIKAFEENHQKSQPWLFTE